MQQKEQDKSAERELYSHELSALREELHDLKTCQITFLTFSVTAMGLLLGLGTGLSGNRSLLGIVLLIPLVIVFPAWWIFFNKATTITRIVGYYRIVETLILSSPKDHEFIEGLEFIGWENGLREFRQYQKDQKEGKLIYDEDSASKPSHSKFDEIFQSSHRYWLICYSVFFSLSGLCIVASVTMSILDWHWSWLVLDGVATVLFLISAYYNARMVWRLTCGSQSYDWNEHLWKQVLKAENPAFGEGATLPVAK